MHVLDEKEKNPCWFGLVVAARSTMLGECYSDTSGSKEVTGLIIRMCKELHGESFNLNPSPARSGSSLGNHFCNQKKKKKKKESAKKLETYASGSVEDRIPK